MQILLAVRLLVAWHCSIHPSVRVRLNMQHSCCIRAGPLKFTPLTIAPRDRRYPPNPNNLQFEDEDGGQVWVCGV